MVGPQQHAEYDLHRFKLWGTLGVHGLPLARDGIRVQGVDGPLADEEIFNPRVVDKDKKGWKANPRDAFEIDAIPSVSQTI